MIQVTFPRDGSNPFLLRCICEVKRVCRQFFQKHLIRVYLSGRILPTEEWA